MKLSRFNFLSSRTSQQGVVLVVALVMLLAMTLIGVTVITGSTLQERMAGNSRQLSLARLNAESALREAEGVIENLGIETSPNPMDVITTAFGTTGDHLYVSVVNSAYPPHDFISADLTQAAGWNITDADGDPVTGAYELATDVAGTNPPRYVIEFIGEMSVDEPEEIDVSVEKALKVKTIPYAFRVTAIGYGQNSNISSIVQSIYGTVDNP